MTDKRLTFSHIQRATAKLALVALSCLLTTGSAQAAPIGGGALGLATGFSGNNAQPNSTVKLTGTLTNANGGNSSINISSVVSSTGAFSIQSPITNQAESMTGTLTYRVKVGSSTQTNTLKFDWDITTSSVRFFGTITPYGSVNVSASGGAGTGAPIVADNTGSFDTSDITSSGFLAGSTNVNVSVTNTEYTCSPCVYTPSVVNSLSYFVGLQTSGSGSLSALATSGTGTQSGSGSSALSGLGNAAIGVAAGLAAQGLSSLLGGGTGSGSNSNAVKSAVIDPLQAMTEELTSGLVNQSVTKTEAADAAAQKSTDMAVKEDKAEITKELTPAEVECDIDSLNGQTAPELAQTTVAQERVAAQHISDAARGVPGTSGGMNSAARAAFRTEQIQRYCRPGDMGGALDDFCDSAEVQLNTTALYGGQGTLDVDFSSGDGSQFDQVSTLLDTLIEPMQLPTADQLQASAAERARFGSTGLWIINHKDDLSDAVAQIIAPNVGGSNANEDQMRAFLTEINMDPDQQDRYFTPDGKISEDAQLEILTHYYFMSPKFMENIQDSESALARVEARMEAVNQLLNVKIQQMSALKNREMALFNAIDIRNEANDRNRAMAALGSN